MIRTLQLAGLALSLGLLAGPATAETVYNFSTSVDFTGPFADVMPSWHSGHRAIVAWWNDTKGKELGVKAELKVYDMRYDPATVAKTWPGIVAGDHPVMHLGMGTPDLVSLMKRLPEDKVPMIMPTAMVGLVWAPNGWHFSFRPTYSHEFAALTSYLQAKLPEKRPLRIATVATQGIAGYEDQVNGMVKLAAMYPDRFAISGKAWVDNQPVNIANEVRQIAEAKPDVIMVATNTAQVVATVRALGELGLSIPIMMSSHNGLSEAAKVVNIKELEGDYSVFAFAPYNQPGLEATAVYKKYHTGEGDWGLAAEQAAAQTLLAMRTLERAVKAVGADKVTGPAMYDALMAGEFPEAGSLGMLPTIAFDKTAPFPVGTLKAKALTVTKGEIVPLTADWLDVPKLEKW